MPNYRFTCGSSSRHKSSDHKEHELHKYTNSVWKFEVLDIKRKDSIQAQKTKSIKENEVF
jgi:hypothetical protein